MSYKLSNEQSIRLIEQMNADDINGFFKKSQAVFAKYHPFNGRLDKISDRDKRKFLKEHLNDNKLSIIASFLAKTVNAWIKEMEKKTDPSDSHERIMEKVLDSSFSVYPELYMNIAGIALTPGVNATITKYYLDKRLLSADLAKAISEAAGPSENETRQQEKISELTATIEETEKEVNNVKEALQKYEAWAADEVSLLPEGFDYASLCEVFEDRNGHKWLRRVLDIDTSNWMIQDRIDTDSYKHDRIFLSQKDEHEVGEIGVFAWRWWINSDKDREDSESRYIDIAPIQIVVPGATKDYEGVIGFIRDGWNGTARDVMFVLRTIQGSDGIFVKKEQITTFNDKCRLRDDVYELGLYHIPKGMDVAPPLADGSRYLKSLAVPEPNEYLAVYSDDLTVGKIIARSISQQMLKRQGFSTSEARKVKEFLESVQHEDIYKRVVSAFHGDITRAEDALKAYIARADQIIAMTDFNTSIIMQVVKQHPDILESFRNSIQGEYEETIKEKVKEENERHLGIEEELRDKIADLEKQLHKSVEDQSSKQTSANEAIVVQPPAISSVMQIPIEEGIPCADIEKMSSISALINVIASNLYGVEAILKMPLAIFLYAAYHEHYPVALCGPYAEHLADVMSASIFGKSADKTDGTGFQDGEIVVIRHPFTAQMEDHLPSILEKMASYKYLVTPYREDILLEPHSLSNYILPVFTEMYFTRRPIGRLHGGQADIQKYRLIDDDLPVDIQKLQLSRTAKNRLADVMQVMDLICDDIGFAVGKDETFYTCIFPLMYWHRHIRTEEDLKMVLRDKEIVLKETEEAMLNDFLGE